MHLHLLEQCLRFNIHPVAVGFSELLNPSVALWLCLAISNIWGLPRWLSGKESACQCRGCGRSLEFNPWVEKMPWGRKRQPTAVFLPGKPHKQRILAGYSPGGHNRVRRCSVAKQHCPLFPTKANFLLSYKLF